ncbi:MAG: flagellar hook-associated protein FlgK [Sedimenticolaceae bacterium]
MAGIINSGISALNAFKRQLETTGHNIANVNTEGYSRQVVQFQTRAPQALPQGFIGSGVEVASVRRRYDDFLATRVRDYTSSHAEYDFFLQRANQVDNVIADASAGINDAMQMFFASVNDVADDPTDIAARSVMISRADQLGDRFHSLDGWFEDMRRRLNQDLERQVDEINSFARSLADVNARIRTAGSATGGVPNDLLDERDKLIDDLSEFTSVSTVEEADGVKSVFIGTGQALVVGTTYSTMGVTNNPLAVDRKELVIQQAGGGVVTVTEQMTGGSLGGALRFRDGVLDESQNALGRVALGLASFFNAEHQTGMDLDGQLGGAFFNVASPKVVGAPSNAGSITVGHADFSQLTTHDYRMDFDGASWTMTDLTSGQPVALSGTGSVADPFLVDGLRIVINSAAAGDSYLVQPTRNGASGFDALVANERQIAAAEAVTTSSNPANSGTGLIGPGALTARAGAGAGPAPPVGITLAYQAGNQLAITVPPGAQFVDASGAPIGGSVAYLSGETYRVDVPGLGIFDFDMTGAPAVGDSFSLSDNVDGIGDNRNARRLADLQTANLMLGGTASFATTYGALVADVGTKTQQASSNAGVQERLLAQAQAAKDEVSGVNLDEEAADLVRFQQAYQAAAQVINVANSLFDTLLGAVRR